MADKLVVVSRVMVSPAARGLGIGARLFDTASSAARSREQHPVLYTGERDFAAHKLYGRFGWLRTGETPSELPNGDNLTLITYVTPPPFRDK